jgi:diguanylate cyclase (GGDEF)-like protein
LNAASAPLAKAVLGLIQGIGRHVIEGEAQDLEHLRATLARGAAAFTAEAAETDLAAHTSVILRALEEYNRRTERACRRQSIEYQHMVQMLADTLGEITSTSQENLEHLREFESQIVWAAQIDDVRMLKARLSDCLKQIREEAARQRLSTQTTVERLRGAIRSVEPSAILANEAIAVDATTGLPGRSVAEGAIQKACEREDPWCMAALTIERMQTLNAAFGVAVGDQVLTYYAGFLRRHLQPADAMFRWSGPTLIVLMPRSNGMTAARLELERLTEHKYEHTVRTATRTILLPISVRWTVLPQMASSRLLIQKIDQFIAQPGTPD